MHGLWGFAVGRPVPAAEAPCLVVGRVRAGGQLAVALLARDPGLAVVLLRRRRAEVADGDVDDAVGDLQLGEDPLLDRQQPLVLLRRLGGLDEREHLDLVELVDAEDAAGVAAGGAGLAAEAGREAGVAQRQRRRRRGSRRRAGAASDTSEVPTRKSSSFGDLVDLVAVAGQEAGPVRAPPRGRAPAARPARGPRRGPGRSRSGPAPARAAPGRPSGRRSASRRARAAASMSIRPSSVPISRWSRGSKSKLGGSPTSRSDDRVLLGHPVGSVGVGQVRQRQRSSSLRARLRPASSSALPASIASFSSATAAISRLGVAALALGLADLLGGVLRSAWASSTSGSSSRRRASRPSSSSTSLGGAAARQRRLDPLGVGADQLQVEHGRRYGSEGEVSGRGAASSRLPSPAYLATKRATASASLPTTMFCGMIAPEKPPFWIAKRASS